MLFFAKRGLHKTRKYRMTRKTTQVGFSEAPNCRVMNQSAGNLESAGKVAAPTTGFIAPMFQELRRTPPVLLLLPLRDSREELLDRSFRSGPGFRSFSTVKHDVRPILMASDTRRVCRAGAVGILYFDICKHVRASERAVDPVCVPADPILTVRVPNEERCSRFRYALHLGHHPKISPRIKWVTVPSEARMLER